MSEYRVQNLARILVNYSNKIQPNDLVLIFARPFHPQAMPLFREVYREVLRAGAHPHFFFGHRGFEDMEYIFFSSANEEQLRHIDPFYRQAIEEFDSIITIMSESNTHRLAKVDPAKVSLYHQANADLFSLYFQKVLEGQIRWVGTLYPSSGYAQDADMSLEEYENFFYRVTHADEEDPISYWEGVHKAQQRIVDWLQGKREVQIKGPHADLTFSIEGRSFMNCDGTLNMPDGEICTSPVEESVNGWIRYTYPAIRGGNEVEGIELHFEQGRVTKAHAEKNDSFLQAMLDTDEGARYLGEFAIGTNDQIDRFTKSILFDEKIGGTIHLAIGDGLSSVGGKNKSGIHWDMICDMRDGGQIFVDGEKLYESGEFLI